MSLEGETEFEMSDEKLDAIKLLTLRQVAEALGRSPTTIDDWCRKGLFPAPLQAVPVRLSSGVTPSSTGSKNEAGRVTRRPPRGQLKQNQN